MKASGSGLNAREFVQGREHVERGGVAVGIMTGRQPLRLLLALAAGEMGHELEQHIGGGRERDAVDQLFAQRAAADGEIRRRIDRSEHRLDQRGIVGGKIPNESPTA